MADYLIKGETLSGIADAIRSKTGSSAPVAVSSMASQIAGITGGGGSDVTLLENLPFELDFASGDMSFTAPDGYAVKSAIVKKPDTLIPANIKSGVEVAGITGTLSGGGANPDANDPVYYVTFMNGDQKLYVRPVVRGENCTDVVANNIIPTPTKESDVQYNYTFYGWGASDGGAANSGILNNITEDKTVYAIYTKTLRTYTITYLDEDGTILHSEPVAYGSIPNYVPKKDGAGFAGWIPTPVAVTGEASYTATWSNVFVSGKCGTNITYALYTNGLMTIDGSGAMTDYTSSSAPPWEEYKDSIESVVISNGVTHVGGYTFANCTGITNLEIPDSVTSIGAVSFKYCTGLTNIVIPNGVTKVGASAFAGCPGVTSIPDSVTDFGYTAFQDCTGLTGTLTYKAGVTYADNVFLGCTGFTSYAIEEGVTEIPGGAFRDLAQLTSIVIPDSVTSIDINAFYGCTGLTAITLPPSLVTIGGSSFSGCAGLTSITIPESVTTINSSAFNGCTGLTSISIPANVTWIGYRAFYNTSLTNATFADTSTWYYTSATTATNGKSFSIVSSSTAATYLTSTYANYNWYKR